MCVDVDVHGPVESGGATNATLMMTNMLCMCRRRCVVAWLGTRIQARPSARMFTRAGALALRARFTTIKAILGGRIAPASLRARIHRMHAPRDFAWNERVEFVFSFFLSRFL